MSLDSIQLSWGGQPLLLVGLLKMKHHGRDGAVWREGDVESEKETFKCLLPYPWLLFTHTHTQKKEKKREKTGQLFRCTKRPAASKNNPLARAHTHTQRWMAAEILCTFCMCVCACWATNVEMTKNFFFFFLVIWKMSPTHVPTFVPWTLDSYSWEKKRRKTLLDAFPFWHR